MSMWTEWISDQEAQPILAQDIELLICPGMLRPPHRMCPSQVTGKEVYLTRNGVMRKLTNLGECKLDKKYIMSSLHLPM